MEVRKKPNESLGSLMRRFSRLAQSTRIIATAKSRKYRAKTANERVSKNRAIMREELRALRKRLERLGVYNEEIFEEEKRKIKRNIGL